GVADERIRRGQSIRRAPHELGANDPRLGPAVLEELLDGVAPFAVEAQPTQLALEVAEAEEMDGTVEPAAVETVDECRHRSGDATANRIPTRFTSAMISSSVDGPTPRIVARLQIVRRARSANVMMPPRARHLRARAESCITSAIFCRSRFHAAARSMGKRSTR